MYWSLEQFSLQNWSNIFTNIFRAITVGLTTYVTCFLLLLSLSIVETDLNLETWWLIIVIRFQKIPWKLFFSDIGHVMHLRLHLENFTCLKTLFFTTREKNVNQEYSKKKLTEFSDYFRESFFIRKEANIGYKE